MKTPIKLIFISLLTIIVSFYSCSEIRKESHIPSLLDIALQQAKNNRPELEKVLSYYRLHPADSLKYRAACFLIENMPYYTYYKGGRLEQYLTFYSLLRETRGTNITPRAVVDSVYYMYGSFHLDSLQSYKDIETVDSAYLCNNIEWAFKVWYEQPWGKNVSFTDFCEYILPYRIADETLSDWREDIYHKYNHLLDSFRISDIVDKDDPAVAARCLLDSLRKRSKFFTTTVPPELPHVGPEVAQNRTGSCRELSDYVVYVCRALGIPCAIDFMPIHGDGNDGHQWVSFSGRYGDLYYQEFLDALKEVRNSKIYGSSKIKVYRNTFSLNCDMKEEMQKLDSVVVPFFKSPHVIDVTDLYAKSYKKELKIPSKLIYKGKPHSRIAYLCASSRMSWEPVAWTEFDGQNLVFSNIQRGPVMRVATYEQGHLRFWTDPFEVTISNEFHFFTPLDSVQDVTLFSKYPLQSEEKFQNRMLGGTFEVSNDPAFQQKEIIHMIGRKPERLQTVVYLNSVKPYRYIRYVGPEEAHCNVAEITFYAVNDTIPLKGRAMGTPGCYQKDGSHEYPNVFDGNTETSFDCLAASSGWAGLDLGSPKRIGRIVYTPRNYDNYIRPGDEYELFCCIGRDKWDSFGVQISKADTLVYKDVPVNALLLLKNYSRGTQERIFAYENGKQVWK